MMTEPETESPCRGADRTGGRSWLRLLAPCLILAGVLCHPTQVAIYQWGEVLADGLGLEYSFLRGIPAVNVTVSDILFMTGFGAWALLRWLEGTLFSRLRTYPPAMAFVFAAAIISALPFLKTTPPWASPPVVESGEVLRQLIQLGLFFICAFIPLADYLKDPKWRRKILIAFAVTVTMTLLLGLTEYAQFRPAGDASQTGGAQMSALHIDATFGIAGEEAGAGEQVGTRSNRNVLGAWLTLVVPLLFAAFLWVRDVGGRVIALLLCCVGAVLLLHGGLWAAVVVSILALAFIRGTGYFFAAAVGLCVFFGLLFWLAPQQPNQILLDSLMLRRNQDRFRTLPVYSINPQLDESGEVADLTDGSYSPWEQKYIQWQPSLLVVARHPFFGVGLGNYQQNINSYYNDRDFGAYDMPKASMNLMEKGGNPFYAVWTAETGFIGLFSIVWLFLTFFRRAVRGSTEAARRDDTLELSLQIGACAALGAAAFGALFTNYLVRGLGYTLVFVMALTGPSSLGKEE